MKRNIGKRALESYRVFPYIAWTLVIGFSLFVINLASELGNVTKNIEDRSNTIYKNEQIDGLI